ncbi:zinc knuckle CX2CX4HX4C containing protein [Tanacetum coccineum]
MANDAIPCTDTPIVRSVSINSKSTSYTGATCASFSEPKIGKANFRHLESENVFNGVQLSFPMKVVKTVSSRFENTLYGYFIGKRIAFQVVEYYVRNNWAKYEFTRLMTNSKGFFFFIFDSNKGLEDFLENGPWMIHNSQSSFARCLIEVKVDEVLKDSITMGIHLSECMGVTKEIVRSPKNATTIDMTNDGFQTVVNERKSGKTGSANTNRYGVNVAPSVSNSAKDCPNNVQWSSKKQHSKDDDIPSSSYTSDTIKKDGLTEWGDLNSAQDDMESEEEVEVVFDETVNLLSSIITGADTYTAPNVSKT